MKQHVSYKHVSAKLFIFYALPGQLYVFQSVLELSKCQMCCIHVVFHVSWIYGVLFRLKVACRYGAYNPSIWHMMSWQYIMHLVAVSALYTVTHLRSHITEVESGARHRSWSLKHEQHKKVWWVHALPLSRALSIALCWLPQFIIRTAVEWRYCYISESCFELSMRPRCTQPAWPCAAWLIGLW